jgi:hypothetical protein
MKEAIISVIILIAVVYWIVPLHKNNDYVDFDDL